MEYTFEQALADNDVMWVTSNWYEFTDDERHRWNTQQLDKAFNHAALIVVPRVQSATDQSPCTEKH